MRTALLIFAAVTLGANLFGCLAMPDSISVTATAKDVDERPHADVGVTFKWKIDR